ncbi:AraC family transcriptional regulator [Amycolatopsis acidiphila]|uniref:AraC family transcriptional regulator n=1 Tax=Amycolatopsis acidiphila TaxID=715473 RepID=A0A558AN41_9PSEU|nr:AraC family transcriptional regulator [Amycolatopsis acidiphila]TVT25683.1 AraC family transcriptional regulator [Amycolatopsis acidiphila]UIJ60440.1 AraC family transcriptional regulator [Amycolatopsis acidiphila]GHG82879.1 transcriptional regulator [Amycolatopsis acidiphila]
MTALPLENYKLFESRDVDETRDEVGKIFCPHRLDVVGPKPELHARMHCRRMRNIAVTYVSYGWDVRVNPGELDSFFAILVPTAGRGTFQCGFEQIQALPQQKIAIASATEPLHMRLSADCGQLVVRVERAAVEARLSEMIDGALREPVRFQLGMDVAGGYARSWFDALSYGVTDLGRPETMLAHPLGMEQFEQNIITGLLLAQPHNYTAMLNGDDRPVPSRLLGIAVDLMEGHPEWAHTPASLARQAGVSVRALQKAFREQLDSSPSEYLRGVRLQRVHDELCAAQYDVTTVGEIASKWGMAHHGRFAAVYRERFGESPKQTLSRQHARKG